MQADSLSVIILAAGKGTRMRSNRAKVLHEVFFAPMVHHVIAAVQPLDPDRIIAVIGHQREVVQESLKNLPVRTVIQQDQLGTGHAVLIAKEALHDVQGTVMILCGDTPLIQSSTLQKMYTQHRNTNSTLTMMTTILPDPTNYGRIICDEKDMVQAIVEQKDCTPHQLEIKEINGGIYCVDSTFLFRTLENVGSDNSQGEVYLTDIVALGVKAGVTVAKFAADNPLEVLGVNSRAELAEAHKALLHRRNHQLMLSGVTMYNPETITIAPHISVGQDSLFEPNVRISGLSQIGSNCNIGQGSILHNCRIGDNVEIGPYCVLTDCTIQDNQKIAAMCNGFLDNGE